MVCPLILSNLVLYVFFLEEIADEKNTVFTVTLSLQKGKLILQNIRRGVSIIGAAGSGKTESIVHGFLKHFSENQFSGVIHDYKNFELTEITYPLIDKKRTDFYCIGFDPIYHRVNPIAPRYMDSEESVNEVSRVY